MDTTSLRVRAAVLLEAARAYGFRHHPFDGEVLADLCGDCGHHYQAHAQSVRECWERGCGCRAFTDGPRACTGCGRPWDTPLVECPRCGLTITTIVERLQEARKESR